VPACPPVLALIDFIAGATRHGICKGGTRDEEPDGEESQD
jgi:hypothetical protein